MLLFIKRCRAMKSTEINETMYSRIDQVKFVEDSLIRTKWVNLKAHWNFSWKINITIPRYKTKSKS